MLRDRPDADALLAELPFRPPDWHRYYEDLWQRYPTLAADWVHVGYLNLPSEEVTDKATHLRKLERYVTAIERDQRDLRMLAKIRGLVIGVMFKRGPARAVAQRKLDRYLADMGLRPAFPGGSSCPVRSMSGCGNGTTSSEHSSTSSGRQPATPRMRPPCAPC